MLDFSVERVLKGTKRAGVFVGDAYFVNRKVPARVNQRLDRETKYVLFLLDRGDDTRKRPVYEPIAEGDGIVIAEEEMVEAVRSAQKE